MWTRERRVTSSGRLRRTVERRRRRGRGRGRVRTSQRAAGLATTLRAGRELEWNRALVNHAHPDAARGPRGGGRAQPPAAAARRIYPPADGGSLLAAAACGPGQAEG